MNIILQPWPWYVAGPLISFTMFLLFYFGKKLGISSNLEHLCAMGGAGKFVGFFKYDWRKNSWNLMVVLGVVIGGFIASHWLTKSDTIILNPQTIHDLSNIGIKNAGAQYLPPEIYSIDTMLSLKGFAILIIAGFLVGGLIMTWFILPYLF